MHIDFLRPIHAVRFTSCYLCANGYKPIDTLSPIGMPYRTSFKCTYSAMVWTIQQNGSFQCATELHFCFCSVPLWCKSTSIAEQATRGKQSANKKKCCPSIIVIIILNMDCITCDERHYLVAMASRIHHRYPSHVQLFFFHFPDQTPLHF